MDKYNPLNPSQEFVSWILSINRDWRTRIYYKVFDDYVKQAEEWLKDTTRIQDLEEHTEAHRQAVIREGERVKENSLYYMKKWNWYVEASAEGGKLKTTTCDSQDVMCFLMDYGCSMFIAKARGIRSTSTFLPLACLKVRRIKNESIQYICSTETKAKKLFEEKVKWTEQQDPVWLRPTIGSSTQKSREYYRHVSKSERQGMRSKIFIDAPSKDVVNAINPNIVLIDEAPSIGMFDIMMQEARPALFTYDPITKERKMTKQIIAWGSSQEDDTDTQVSDEFENAWKALFENYQKGDYSDGIVPLFFSCWAIPGLTQDQYNNEYKVALSKKKESHLIRFRKHYPTCPDDVFLRNVDTLIPFEDIQGQLDKIYLLIKNKEMALFRGYFMPVYDRNAPLPPEIGSPYRITDAQFIPVDDSQESQATVTIFEHPNKDWVNAYYQGTDPIVGASGHSKFSSVIWDNRKEDDYGKTISAVLNCRHTNYKKDYEQAYCLHLYYSTKEHFIHELLEINVGNEYNTYCEVMRYGYNMIANLELPHYLQVGEQIVGINKKSGNADKILNKTQDLMRDYTDRIFIDEFWNQARTYVRHKNKANYTDSFKPSDKHCFDDVLDAATYAYIASLCFTKEPKNIKVQKEISKPKRRQVMRNGQLVYEEVRRR